MTSTDRSHSMNNTSATRPATAKASRRTRSEQRAERARRRALELELACYTSQSDLLELEAILDRSGDDDIEFRQVVQQLRWPALNTGNVQRSLAFL